MAVVARSNQRGDDTPTTAVLTQMPTHVPVGRRGAQEVNEVLPLYRIGPFFDGLKKKRKERVRSVGIVAVEIAQDGEGNHAL